MPEALLKTDSVTVLNQERLHHRIRHRLDHYHPQKGLKIFQIQTQAETPSLSFKVKLSCLYERPETLLKTDSVTDSITTTYIFIVKV